MTFWYCKTPCDNSIEDILKLVWELIWQHRVHSQWVKRGAKVEKSYLLKSRELSSLGHFYQPDTPIYHEICKKYSIFRLNYGSESIFHLIRPEKVVCEEEK